MKNIKIERKQPVMPSTVTIRIEVPDGCTVEVDRSESKTATETIPYERVTSGVERLLTSFEARFPASRSREMLERLSEQGWLALAPTPRDPEAAPTHHYILLDYRGRASLYLGTRKLVSGRREQKPAVAGLPGADPFKRNDVHFRYVTEAEFSQALAAADEIRRWADGR